MVLLQVVLLHVVLLHVVLLHVVLLHSTNDEIVILFNSFTSSSTQMGQRSLAVCVFQGMDKETAPIILANEFSTEDSRPVIQVCFFRQASPPQSPSGGFDYFKQLASYSLVIVDDCSTHTKTINVKLKFHQKRGLMGGYRFHQISDLHGFQSPFLQLVSCELIKNGFAVWADVNTKSWKLHIELLQKFDSYSASNCHIVLDQY